MSTKKKTIYDIVCFVNANDINGKKSIDCVPSSWVFIDKKSNKIMTKFLPPPYTVKKCKAFHKLVKTNASAPDKWPGYAVEILESAGTYSEALSKLEKLKHEDYTCTTDIEQTDIENETENVQIAKKRKIPPIYDMKGNLSIRRNSSSTDSSNENEVEESDESDESINKEYKKSTHSVKQQKINEKSQDSSSENEVEESDESGESINKEYEKSTHSVKQQKINEKSQEKEPAVAQMVKNKKKSTPNFASNDAMSTNVTIKYLNIILSDVQGLKHDNQIIKNDIRILKEKFEHFAIERNSQNRENLNVHWSKENNIQWPLKTKEDFDNLNILLKNENIRNDFMATIGFVIDSTTPLSKNLLAVIRKFLHRDLTTKFTCVKQIKDKFTLKPSLFYDCIIEVFCANRDSIQQTFSEKTLEKLIGVILTNSKDWDKKRPQKRNLVENEPEGSEGGSDEAQGENE